MSAGASATPVLRAAGLALLGLALLVGLHARLDELGARPLAVDEYYFLTSVDSLREHGTPRLHGGGWYTRGILLQYPTAASIAVVGDETLGGRLPAVLLNLLAVLLLYLYARPQLGRALAGTAAALLLVSSWEVEFARFARMYAGFQCVTLAVLLCVDRVCFEGAWRLRFLPPLLIVAGVAIHQLAVLLLPLLALPLVLPETRRRLAKGSSAFAYLLASCAAGTVALALVILDFRNLGVTDRFPLGFELPASPSLWLPAFPFWSVSADPGLNLLFLVALLAALGLAWLALRGAGRRVETADLVAGASLLAAGLHAFPIALAGLVLLLARYDALGPAAPRRWKAAVAATLGVLAAWLAWATVAPDWHPATGAGSLLGGMRRAFVGWPDLFQPILRPWSEELPRLGAALALAAVFQLWLRRRAPLPELLRNPATLLLGVAVGFGVLRSLYASTRYLFFIYPVALATLALSCRDLAARLPGPLRRAPELAGVALTLAVFTASEDFQPRHLADVSAPDASWRLGAFARFEPTWYPRWDFVSPARFAAARAGASGDRVLVVGLPPVSHYLEAEHAVYLSRDDPRFLNVSRRRGTLDLWSGRRMLTTPDEVRDWSRGASALWVIQPVAADSRRLDEAALDAMGGRGVERMHLAEDGRVEVLRIELSPDA